MPGNDATFGFPRPSKALIGLMLVLVTIWLSLSIGVNWGGASRSTIEVLAGSSKAIFNGEVWRFLSAPFIHDPSDPWHLASTLIVLYFFGTTLEELWGFAKLVRFLAFTCWLSYGLQVLAELILPGKVAAHLIPPFWFGTGPATLGMVIAYCATFPKQVMRINFVLPVSGKMMIILTICWEVARVVTGHANQEGVLGSFGGILFGWLLGGGNPAPLRRWWLKLRLAQLDGKAQREEKARRPRPNPGGLRVIPGGRTDDDDDKGPDGRWLN